MTRPLKWHGGKHYLAKRIVSLMPPHTRYAEPYFGGGAVLFAKPCEGVAEFVNDIDFDLTNFWHVLRTRRLFQRFQWEVNNTPLSLTEWKMARQRLEETPGPEDDIDRIERAVAFLVKYRQSRQALGTSFCTPSSRLRRAMNENVSAWLASIESLPEAHDRMRRVEVWNIEATQFIDRLDSPETLFYVDPPYLHESRTATKAYRYEMTEDDHRALLACLCEVKGRFILSGYLTEMYDDVARQQRWGRIDIQIDNKSSSKKSKPIKTECLWANFPTEAT